VLAVYALVAQASVRRATVGMTAMVLAIGVETVLQHKGFGNFLFGLVFAAAAFAVARVVAHRTDAADDLVARTRQLEESREADARRAVEEERARIARELHDVIAHSVGVMVVQAGGAERVLPKDPAAAVDALRSVQTTGRQALAEMARLVGILRGLGEEIGLAPQPGLAEIATLVDASRAAGLDIDVCIDGTQRALPPGVELTVYRVVQEALTNVRKHGVGSRAAVRVRFGSRDVEVEVRNPTDSANRAGAPGGGHGLIGMRQRVEIYDGRLESGPLPDGTFRVRAEIPVAG
jgi:signal transduction histidine kinase